LLNHVTLFVHMFINRHPIVPEVTDTYCDDEFYRQRERERERERVTDVYLFK